MMTSDNRLPAKINEQIYTELAELMLKDIAEDFCHDCSNPNRTGQVIKLDDPMSCHCRCERIEGILEASMVLLKR